jgi:hypothetical protein
MIKNDFVNDFRPVIASTREHMFGIWNGRAGNGIGPELMPPVGPDEILVVDDRAAVRPAQAVESKLTRLLQEASLPVSHLLMCGLVRKR